MHCETDEKGTAVLFFFYKPLQHAQMNAIQITDAISPLLAERGLFIVDIRISKDDDITITVESEKATVTLDDCEVINRFFTDTFSQDEEDYSLTVTSAGLDGAFKVPAQFRKAIGQKVEVWFKGGKKITGILEAADDERIVVDTVAWERKDINKVKYHIEF